MAAQIPYPMDYIILGTETTNLKPREIVSGSLLSVVYNAFLSVFGYVTLA